MEKDSELLKSYSSYIKDSFHLEALLTMSPEPRDITFMHPKHVILDKYLNKS